MKAVVYTVCCLYRYRLISNALEAQCGLSHDITLQFIRYMNSILLAEMEQALF